MTVTGWNLYELEKVAKGHLPTLSMVYENAIEKFRSAEATLAGLTKVPDQFQGARGSVSSAYGMLGALIIDVLKSNKISLDETAEALHKAARLYAEADQAAAEKLQFFLRQNGTPSPDLTP